MWRWLCLTLGVTLTVGCGDDAECVIDTDCPLPMRCEAQRCVALGRDAGGLDAGAPRDAGMDAAAPADAGADAGPELSKQGAVTVLQTPVADSPPHSFSANFNVRLASERCEPASVDDACTLITCFTPDEPVPDAGVGDGGATVDAGAEPDAGVTVQPNAGTITYAGGLMDLVLTPEADGTYTARTGTGLLWSTDQAVTLMASGADVPAFSETLTAPGHVTVSEPSFLAPPITIDRAADFTVIWSGGTGTVRIALQAAEEIVTGGTQRVSLRCDYDAAAGTATIPSATLEMLSTGPGGSLSISSEARSTLTLDDWQVTVRASARALGDTGGAASSSLTISDSTP